MPKSKIAKESVFDEPVSVTIEKASNGYLIRSYRDTGTMLEVAMDLEGAQKIQSAMLGKEPKNAKA